MPDSDLFLFISHVSEDRASAMEIVEELERRGIKCWIAPRDVHPGQPFDDEIVDAIEGSRAMLLLFSDLCNESEYIRREVTVAGESHKVIIPFRIEDAQPRRGLRVRLSDLHWIDGFAARERAIDDLAREFAPAPPRSERVPPPPVEERDEDPGQRAVGADYQACPGPPPEPSTPEFATAEAVDDLERREPVAQTVAGRPPLKKSWLAASAIVAAAVGLALFVWSVGLGGRQAPKPQLTVQPAPSPATVVPSPAPAPAQSPPPQVAAPSLPDAPAPQPTPKLDYLSPGRTLSGHRVAFSPDGRVLASGSEDHTIKLWDAATGQVLRTLIGHSEDVDSVAFSPDGRVLASGSGDKTIKLWDAASGRMLRTLSDGTTYIDSVAFSPDGRVLASGSYDRIKLWDVASGRLLRTLNHSVTVASVAFSPDGQVLASGTNHGGDGTIKLWNAASGQLLRTLGAHTEAVASVAFSPDGQVLASGSWDHTIKLWDVASGQRLRMLFGHSGTVDSVAFSPDGRVLASGSDDHTIKLWDVSNVSPANR